jgi:DoxX
MLPKEGCMFAKVVLVSRILLGLIFFVFGLNGLLMFTVGKGFIPMPPPPEHMMAIMGGFMATKYMMPLVKLLEVAAGLMLLTNLWVNLALVILAPIVVNIVGIHLFVELSGLPMALFIVALMAVLFKARWAAFRPLLAR